MAKKNLTLDEKLEEAIVKDGAYEVPGNWVWSNIGNISLEIKNGTTIKQNKDEGGIKVTRIESLQNNSIDINRLGTIIETEKLKEKDYYEDGDIALSHINSLEHVGKTALIDKTLLPLIHGMNLLRIRVNRTLVLPKFFQFYTRGYDYKDEVVDRVNRAVNQVSLNQKNLSEIPFPIPPLKEQQRIVDRIESLFEKLDKAKELIEEVREGFEKRKQSIIERSLKGEFLSGIQLKEIELGSILNYKNGLSKRSGKEGTDTKVLRLADIEDDNIFSENSRKMLLTEKERENYSVINGDLIIIRVNGTKSNVGKAIQYHGNEVCAYCDHLIRIDSEGYNKDYIKFLINSDEVRKQINELIVSSAGQNTISQSSLNIIKANIIDDLRIQEEIVNSINNFVFKEKKIEELTQLEEQIELIKKSILAKAFRGELETNSEEDESSLELLKEILSKE